jgi:hypothetical protein
MYRAPSGYGRWQKAEISGWLAAGGSDKRRGGHDDVGGNHRKSMQDGAIDNPQTRRDSLDSSKRGRLAEEIRSRKYGCGDPSNGIRHTAGLDERRSGKVALFG